MRHFKLVLYTVLILITPYIYSQSAYIRIVDSQYIPRVEELSSNNIRLIVSNTDFQSVLDKFSIIQFKHVYDSTEFEWFKSIYLIEMSTDSELDEFLLLVENKFKIAIPYVEKIEKTFLTESYFIPNDSLYLSGDMSHLDLVRVPEAWDIARHYGKIKVGIADTYFCDIHPDLVFDTIIGNNNFNHDDHGTVVSGFIVGKTNNDIGVASAGGFNTILYATNLHTNIDLLYLAMLGCKVINCSWFRSFKYSSDDDEFFESLLNDYDCLVVFGAANGINHGGNLYGKCYPASYESCLSVTSVGHKYNYGDSRNHNWKDVHNLDVNDTTTSYHHNSAVDVCAPGYEVISTNYWDGKAGYNEGKSGTSFSAPIVTGIAAMVRAVNPSLTAAQTMQIIKETADASIYDIPENAPYIGKLGTGRVDAYAAVRKACAVDVENEVYPEDETLEGCIVTLKDVTLQDNSTLTIDAVVETELISNIEVPFGTTLIIK